MMDHRTGQALLNRLTHEGVWVVGTDRSPRSRAERDETETTKTARRRMRLGSRRAHARTALGARA